MEQNGTEWCTEWFRVVQSGIEWNRVVQSGTEWYRVAQSGTEWYRDVQSGTEWYRVRVLSPAGPDPPAPFVPLAWLVPNLT